jgi:hypothetical protein
MRFRHDQIRRAGLVSGAALGFAAIVTSASIACAQQSSEPPPDPSDTVYGMGSVEEDPAVEQQRAIVRQHRSFLPLQIDLSSHMPEVGNQKHSESCSAWATAYAARSYYTSAVEKRNVRRYDNIPSPNYVYHLSRAGGCDAGSTVGRAAEVLSKGALSLADYPFTDVCTPPPSPEQVARAHDFLVRGISRVDIARPDDVKGQLARANPVMISFKVGTAFMKHRGAGTFTEAAPPAEDKAQGWHAMTLVGYDERRQAFRLINSWGKSWGDRGYAWIGYDLLRTRIRGAWVLDVAGASNNVVPPAPAPQPQPQPQPGPEPVPSPSPALSELQTLSCARVRADQQGGRTVLIGYVASDEDLARVAAIAARVPGTALGKVIVAPWPQCETLQTLEKPLDADDRPSIDIGPRSELAAGEPLRIRLRSPGHISYLYVSYIQADGSVLHLAQPRGAPPQPTMPRQALSFGSGEGGQQKFTIGAPFGREMVIAIAARSPLFEHELPVHQTEREFLTDLRRALVYKPVPDLPDRQLAATITTLQTRAK